MYVGSLSLVLVVVVFKIQVIFSMTYGSGFDVYAFKRDWCRQRKAALDWKAILEPCERDMEYSIKPRSSNLT